MKITYIYMLLFPVVILGCQKPKDYAELSGKITNPNSQQITLSNETGYEKTIVVNSDGTFSDTLKVYPQDATFLLMETNMEPFI